MDKLERIVEDLSGLTLIEAAKLVKQLEETWGVSAQQPVVQVARQSGEIVDEPVEQVEFDVRLVALGPERLAVIKAIRKVTGLGLKESKDAVDSLPYTLSTGVDKGTALSIKSQVEEVGATIEIS